MSRVEKDYPLEEERNKKLDRIVERGVKLELEFRISLGLLRYRAERQEERLITDGAEQFGEKMIKFKKEIQTERRKLEEEFAVKNYETQDEYFKIAEKYNKELRELKSKGELSDEQKI